MWVKKFETRIRYSCLWAGCGILLDDIEQLELHLDRHILIYSSQISTNGVNSVCSISGCGIFVDGIDELTRHMKMHVFHAEKQGNGLAIIDEHLFDQEILNCKFPSTSRIVYQGEALICEWNKCMASFVDINKYVLHLNEHIELLNDSDLIEGGFYPCLWAQCSAVNKKKSKLKIHVNGHSCEKMCACPFCGAFFSTVQKILDHVLRRQNTGPSDFVCAYCHKFFRTERLLKIHCQRHIQNFICPVCSASKNSNWGLQRHIQTVHMKIRNFVCEHCNRSFSQKSDMIKHAVLHFDDTPHECEVCGKNYRWEKQLRQHMKTHDEKQVDLSYVCHLCDSRYKEGSSLSKHFKSQHQLPLPDGFSRFVYKKCSDGLFRLQSKRCLNKSLLDKQTNEIALFH